MPDVNTQLSPAALDDECRTFTITLNVPAPADEFTVIVIAEADAEMEIVEYAHYTTAGDCEVLVEIDGVPVDWAESRVGSNGWPMAEVGSLDKYTPDQTSENNYELDAGEKLAMTFKNVSSDCAGFVCQFKLMLTRKV